MKLARLTLAMIPYLSMIVVVGCGKFERESGAPASPVSSARVNTADDSVTCRLWNQYSKALNLALPPEATGVITMSRTADSAQDLVLKSEVADKTIEVHVVLTSFNAEVSKGAPIAELQYSSKMNFIDEVGLPANEETAGRIALIENTDTVVFDKTEAADESSNYSRHLECRVNTHR